MIVLLIRVFVFLFLVGSMKRKVTNPNSRGFRFMELILSSEKILKPSEINFLYFDRKKSEE